MQVFIIILFKGIRHRLISIKTTVSGLWPETVICCSGKITLKITRSVQTAARFPPGRLIQLFQERHFHHYRLQSLIPYFHKYFGTLG